MESITKQDLILINNLSSRRFTGNRLLSNASEQEKKQLETVTKKLKVLAEYFSAKYTLAYGPFETSVSTGNPIAIGGTSFKRVWSGIFKGAPNKQYAAQISFVMNTAERCLDVGFYFGRASGHSLNKEQRTTLESQLKGLGVALSDAIINNEEIRSRYNTLFDYGFKTFMKGSEVSPEQWLSSIRTNTSNTQIVARIFPNDFDIIENSTIDYFVSQVMFLMGAVGNAEAILEAPEDHIPAPLTAQQRAKQAERQAEIGLKGELFVLEQERARLHQSGIQFPGYPKHVASISARYGYDILSKDINGKDLFIEVKTTTRNSDDPYSKRFFMSLNEYAIFSANTDNYRVYRVYDIEGTPAVDILELSTLTTGPDGYIMEY